MTKEPMKMLIFFVARCFRRFCSARHLCFTLKTKTSYLNVMNYEVDLFTSVMYILNVSTGLIGDTEKLK